MNPAQRNAQDTEVTAAALGWLERFLRDDISTLPAEELGDWAKWSAHEPNLEHFRRLSRTWRNLGPALAGVAMPADADVVTDDYDGSEPVFEWLGQQQPSPRKSWHLPVSRKFWAIAALIPLLAFVLVKFGHQMLLREMLDDRVQAYSTGPSQHQVVELPDGSKITLGARTELSTHYTANRRVIFLDRGEAWFDVAHNPSRPFTVLAGVGAITALGTQFDVRRELDSSDVEHVTVTVGTGTVEVGPPRETVSDNVDTFTPAQPKWTRARLVKGEQLTYGTDGVSGAITTADLEAATAWKEGRLEYRQTPFKIVIPRVNRYSEKPIELADDEVAELPYSGTVFEGQVADWLRALQTAYPIEVVDTPDRIVIRSRAAAGGEHAGQGQAAPQ